MTIDEFRSTFDTDFRNYIENRIKTYKDFTNNEAILEGANQVAKIVDKGKRVRPYLTYLSYKMHGGSDFDSIKEVLFATELFHAFCLIHDDIIDDDDMRRGVPTVHAILKSRYTSSKKADSIAKSQAILVGDLVFSWVFELLVNFKGSSGLHKEFFFTIDEVVIGQMIDVDITSRKRATKEEIIEKMKMKTAGYTFIQPLRIGRLLAGKDGRLEILDDIGLKIGLAFQMQDDLIDVMSDAEISGKDTASDIAEAQHTLLTQHVFDHGEEQDRNLLAVCLGQAVDEEKLEIIRNIFKKTGAISSLESEVADYFKSAKEKAAKLEVEEEYRSYFLDFISYVENRSY